MELKYIVMTIIKILISVPSILLIINDTRVQAAALMGGYLDNNSNSTNLSNFSTSNLYETFDSREPSSTNSSSWQAPSTAPTDTTGYQNEKQPKSNESFEEDMEARTVDEEEEEIPDPSALVVPGYNLPENIFNKGKPFYLEKDPLTGKVDFDSRTSLLNVNDDEFDYVEDEEEIDSKLYDKANIDRKDGSIGSHKASDVNQLTPNFHDFLNLPVKYNPDKYVYPLISSSYANTKVQGNLHKYQQALNNHKSYVVTTYRPTVSPNYYYTLKTPYYDPNNPTENDKMVPKVTSTTTTTTTTTTTAPRPTTTTTTTKSPNLMDNFMNHPMFEDSTTQKSKPSEIYLTTKGINDVYLTTKRYSAPTTTKRPLSIFEQLFGEYEDEYLTTTGKPMKPPSLFQNLPSNKNTPNKYDAEYDEENTVKPEGPQENNVLSGTGMGHESAYEYEDDYGNIPSESINTIYQTKPVKFEIKSTAPSSSSTLITSTTSPFTTPTTRTTTTARMSTTTATTTTTTTPRPSTEGFQTDYYPSMPDSSEYDTEYEENEHTSKKWPTSTETTTSTKVTSLPLGENHFGTPNFRPPIIAMTNNLKEQLNNEKVISSASNIHISPDQDSVSFVVGNHQSIGGSGGFIGSAFKEGPFDHSPFRPLIVRPEGDKDTVSYTVEAKPEFVNKPVFSQNFPEPPYKPQPKIPEVGGSSINIQPIKTSEASLSIGVPINGVKKIPGQVVDENLENEKIEFPKQGTGAKIVFPDDKDIKHSTITPDLQPPPPSREVLQLSSKPMYHQLPSDLTPPSEQDLPPPPPPHLERPRPPWDPRPGHFYSGRPEYIRPPRPQAKPGPGEIYKRIDNLPNILPQFRPNVKGSGVPHYFDHFSSMKNGYMRQPLLERPSNRPVGFFEKLIPPPPPKNLHNLRKVPILEQDLRIKSIPEEANIRKHEQYDFFQHKTPPPQPVLINRRKSEEPTVETLQMIQAKQIEKKDTGIKPESAFKTNLKVKETTEKPLYVVYPVNSAPIKLDALDSGKKETVVVGTRAELPLPPSKINQEFNYESPKDRNDAPILKPHPKPSNFPIKSDFPYHLERPDIAPSMTSSTFTNSNNIELKEDSKFASNNQWGAVQTQDTESRILTGINKINYKNPNQISVTLKTYTEKPIAVAYTPTEPYKRLDNTEKYSMPNYASPVISEIRPSGLMDKGGSEITVSAVMHTHPQLDLGSPPSISGKLTYVNHKTDMEEMPAKLDFQAPFQASHNIDGVSQGWTVVRNNNNNNSNERSKIDRSDQEEETTTIAIATTSEFDMKNFKPQFFGGFKPIYSYPDDDVIKSDERGVDD